jgi:Ca2+/Na+ antiporter
MKNEISIAWGWLPVLCVTTAVGLFTIAVADRAGITGKPFAEWLFWLGLLIVFVPIAVRLLSAAAYRRERIALVIVLGMALYLVKFMHSPHGFTFADEFLHEYNAQETLRTHHLFNENPILPITPFYPGLQIVVDAVAVLSGLSPFASGIVVIGAARLVLALALFLFFEAIAGSSRVGGLATLLYMTNANFLFWLAQLSYQSLALPLALLLVFLICRYAQTNDRTQRIAFGLAAVLILLTVVVTHHLTTYAVVGFVWLLTLLFLLFDRRKQANPWWFAVIAYIAAFAWLKFVAPTTVDYLLPLMTSAFASLVQFATGQSGGRELFQSAAGYVAPLWERVVGIGSVVVTLLDLPGGLWRIWQSYRPHPFALALALMAPAYFATLLLRFTGSSWEIGNRSAMFLYIGVAFVVALGIVELRLPARAARLSTLPQPRARSQWVWLTAPIFAVMVAIIFVGNAIAGWPPNDRLPRPYTVATGTQLLEPPGVWAAQWIKTFLGTGNRIAADGSNARLLLAYGRQYPLTGDDVELRQMLIAPQVDHAVRETLRDHGIAYVFFDRRKISWDHMVGTFFDRNADVQAGTIQLFDASIIQKFDRDNTVDRIFDDGNIVIYDVRGVYAGN